jgi:type II secretory pathway pseudopilin PulG
MKRFPNLRKGFTLIEMILYVGISSIMLFSLSLLLTFLLGSRVKNQSIGDVNQQGLQVMQLVTQTIRNAKSIDAPVIGATSTILSVTMFDPLKSPTVFSVINGVMYITEGSNASVSLTNSHVTLSSLLFQNISGVSSTDRIVRLSFAIDHNNPSGRNENSFEKVFSGSATLRQ